MTAPLCLDDFERMARRRLPPMLHAFVAGGAETNAALRDNRAAFDDLAFLPRVLTDVSARSQRKTLFGRSFAHPFGIAPMGGAGLCAHRADLALAEAAQAAGIPMILSGGAIAPLEEVHAAAPGTWFQMYVPGRDGGFDPMLRRVAMAGYTTLVVTVDVPVAGNREHYIRNGFSYPLRPSVRLAWQAATHPRWLLGMLARTIIGHGMPHIENMDAERGPAILGRSGATVHGGRDRVDWRTIRSIRESWPGTLILKGILSPADALLARDAGADGIVVSNHGGRQLDHALAPMRALPAIRRSVPDIAVLLDGGVRRGGDVLKALDAGADFVLVGRPFLFAAVTGGRSGVAQAIALLGGEVERNMALLGLTTLERASGDRFTVPNAGPVTLSADEPIAVSSFSHALRR